MCQNVPTGEPACPRWKARQGDDAKRLKKRETEDGHLSCLVAELALDKQLFQEGARKASAPGPAPAVEQLDEALCVSQRRTCPLLEPHLDAAEAVGDKEATLVWRMLLTAAQSAPFFGAIE